VSEDDWKGFPRKWSWLIEVLSGLCLEATKKTTKGFRITGVPNDIRIIIITIIR
jgi:hypothetical protein